MAKVKYDPNKKRTQKVGVIGNGKDGMETLAGIIYEVSKNQKEVKCSNKSDLTCGKEAEEME